MRTGTYGDWEWSEDRKCWELMVRHRIYPHAGGQFVVASNSGWHGGTFPSFEAAEEAVVNGKDGAPARRPPAQEIEIPIEVVDEVLDMLRGYGAFEPDVVSADVAIHRVLSFALEAIQKIEMTG